MISLKKVLSLRTLRSRSQSLPVLTVPFRSEKSAHPVLGLARISAALKSVAVAVKTCACQAVWVA